MIPPPLANFDILPQTDPPPNIQPLPLPPYQPTADDAYLGRASPFVPFYTENTNLLSNLRSNIQCFQPSMPNQILIQPTPHPPPPPNALQVDDTSFSSPSGSNSPDYLPRRRISISNGQINQLNDDVETMKNLYDSQPPPMPLHQQTISSPSSARRIKEEPGLAHKQQDPSMKRRISLEKNRIAASKCRQRKRIQQMQLKRAYERVTEENLELKRKVDYYERLIRKFKKFERVHFQNETHQPNEDVTPEESELKSLDFIQEMMMIEAGVQEVDEFGIVLKFEQSV